ncbi:hypothetical protein [Dyadobacter fermentans]|uniref:Uncharacterized protein n=1 Tax=Dyadobacter fermentans (strain ATCC 700827 / DSM 18053 / CIP 107007 / KCTC 52180 / NS114) TaxID=471854 RepID=C6VUF7_DYAFD|nr:hypothetical protein [Dyadobacter fermentans]ACT96639.1 hypothetical protein Dfer_5448 [Dyadobacter fermentans DSM 18053]
MNHQLLPAGADRSLLLSVRQKAEALSEADFSTRIFSGADTDLLQSLGIRSGANVPVAANAPSVSRWRDITLHAGIDRLKSLFANTRTIPFSEWSDIGQATDIWYGMLADVIRPLGRRDWEFIFYLGNPAARHFFDVDEIMDVMASFAKTGNVTLALEEQEAQALWSLLFSGKQVPPFDLAHPDARARYRSVFQTMEVSRLAIYSESRALLLTETSHFEVVRPPVPAHTHNPQERANFIEGYALGLESGMDAAESLVLGIATSGSVSENSPTPTKTAALHFLNQWKDSI